MIIAGDYIEHSLGMIMTISTMAAAALGNTFSDVLGIGSAVYVERFVEIIGIRPPDLTPVQLEMKSARRASNMVSFNLTKVISFCYGDRGVFVSFAGPRVGYHRRMSFRNDSTAVHEGEKREGGRKGEQRGCQKGSSSNTRITFSQIKSSSITPNWTSFVTNRFLSKFCNKDWISWHNERETERKSIFFTRRWRRIRVHDVKFNLRLAFNEFIFRNLITFAMRNKCKNPLLESFKLQTISFELKTFTSTWIPRLA